MRKGVVNVERRRKRVRRRTCEEDTRDFAEDTEENEEEAAEAARCAVCTTRDSDNPVVLSVI